MANKQRTKSKFSKKYSTTHWAEYNRSLVQRGNFAILISSEVLASWKPIPNQRTRGGQHRYSDIAIDLAFGLVLTSGLGTALILRFNGVHLGAVALKALHIELGCMAKLAFAGLIEGFVSPSGGPIPPHLKKAGPALAREEDDENNGLVGSWTAWENLKGLSEFSKGHFGNSRAVIFEKVDLRYHVARTQKFLNILNDRLSPGCGRFL